MNKTLDEQSACEKLQGVLHNEIPLTQSMGIWVTHCDANKVELCAPLTPNINHKCTAFGGSLYSVAVLCGWGFVYQQMQLNNVQGHIVIQHSEVNYKHPVDGELHAVCKIDDQKALTRFIKMAQRKGHARLKLKVSVIFNNKEAVLFTGQYVIHP